MLPEDKRAQLDGIVQKMVQNKEPDSNIRFVVDDFKKKYTPTEAPVQQPNKPEGIGGLQGFGAGLAKSGLNLARGTAQVLQSGGQRILGAVTPGLTYQDIRKQTGLKSLKDETPEGAGVKKILEPEGTAEKFGSFVGDTAQFAMPLSRVSKVGQVATEATRLQKATGLGKRVLAEGAVGGAVATAQAGEFDREAKDTAIISALFPAAGKVIKSTAQVFKNPKNAGRVVNSLIRPLAKDFSYGKNPGRAIAEEGIVANNMDDLVQKIDIRRNEVGEKINLRLSSPEIQKVKMDVSGILKPLNDAYDQAMKTPRVNSGVITRLTDTINDILGVKVENGTNIPTRALRDISPLQATELKRLIGDITKFTGNQSDDKLVNKALKQAYGIAKGKIEEAVPGIKPLNERYADLLSAKVATEYRDVITQRQGMVGFTNKVSAGIGAGTSIFTGNPIPALVGLGFAGVNKAMATPAFKTRFAKWMASASVEQKRQLIQKAPWIKGVIQSSMVGD